MRAERNSCCLLLAAALTAGCGSAPGDGRGNLPEGHDADKFEFIRILMGTSVRILVCAEGAGGAEDAEKAAKAAFAKVAEVDAALSDYRPDSELSRLNDAAGGPPRAASPLMRDAIEASIFNSSVTHGAFDPTVGPLVGLWREARKSGRLPDPGALAAARTLVSRADLRLDRAGGTVRLARPGMRLDFGGIGKGFAADRALAVLRGLGFPRAMVACAGDIAVGDPPPGRSGWRIRIGADENAPVAVVSACGVSTSGDTEQFVEIDGRRYSHIVDPRTGLGVERVVSASVIDANATNADARATALCVLGPDAGIRLAEELEGVEARMVWREGGGLRTAQTGGLHGLMAPGNSQQSTTNFQQTPNAQTPTRPR